MLGINNSFFLKFSFQIKETTLKTFCTRMHLTTSLLPQEFTNLTKSLFPPLTFESHKGQHGRILVVGGSIEYTGAPYYAAISALKLGADLVHIFCPQDAAMVIKSYSPDLIVHPLLDRPERVGELRGWLSRMHSVVVGPGLGADEAVIGVVKELVAEVQALGLPLTIDADGLRLVTKYPSLIKGHHNTTITPNAVEFNRIATALGLQSSSDRQAATQEMSQLLGNVTVISKGPTDVISDGNTTVTCDLRGCARRCGGQGDVLAGLASTLAHWASINNNNNNDLYKRLGASVSSATAACLLVRRSSSEAFGRKGRSMLTTDVIDSLSDIVAGC